MLAAYHGHAQLVKLLIDNGADPNRLNDRGQSPLAGAVFKMEDEVVEVLFSSLFPFLFLIFLSFPLYPVPSSLCSFSPSYIFSTFPEE